jgi:hypothetical protein
MPVTVKNNNSGATAVYYSVLQGALAATNLGYTVLDLSQFLSPIATRLDADPVPFNPGEDMQLIIRNTLPYSAFNCSGQSVPYNTEVYTNVDQAGATLMGPYLPLVDYVDPTNTDVLAQPANTQASDLPDPNDCGIIPSPPYSNGQDLSLSTPLTAQWPTYWPNGPAAATTQLLNCSTNQSGASPAVYFAASQIVGTEAYGTCDPPAGQPCSSTVYSQPATNQAFGQPPLPVALVGAGFGYLPSTQLPYVGPASALASPASSQLLRIQDCAAGKTCPSPDPYLWDTASSPDCQVYVANWTDTSVWLEANLPQDTENLNSVTLSPVADLSPLTFFPALGCTVSKNDVLTFAVANPQTGNPLPSTFSVSVQ